jgi:hypothetical protein
MNKKASETASDISNDSPEHDTNEPEVIVQAIIEDTHVEESKEIKEAKAASKLKDVGTDIVYKTPKELKEVLRFQSYNEFWDFMTKIAKSKVVNVDSPEDALAAFTKLSELGVPWANGMDHLFKIGSKTGTGFHIINGLALKPSNNIQFKVIKDAEIVYNYIGRDGDKLITLKEEDLPTNYKVVSPVESQVTKDKLKAEGYYLVLKQPEVVFTYEIDKVKIPFINKETIIEFTRTIKLGNVVTELKSIGKFTNRMAYEAGIMTDSRTGVPLLDKPWFKYNDNQLYIRAYTFGVKRIADDILNGIYEVSELLDAYNIPYKGDGDGNMQFEKAEVVE